MKKSKEINISKLSNKPTAQKNTKEKNKQKDSNIIII